MENKRGISEVVGIILIVLISITAIIIVWTVLRPVIQGGADRVQPGCIDVSLKVNSCSTTSAKAIIQRDAGGGAAVTKIQVVLYNASGSFPQAKVAAPSEFGTYSQSLTGVTAPNGINVAGIIESASGEEITCPLLLRDPYPCTA